jgi:ADP-heptose:LPS heptosyltransferase
MDHLHDEPDFPLPEPRSLLVVRYSALGDVVLATSVLEPLRRRFPRARIEWLTDASCVPLLRGLPELDAVHTRWRRGQGRPRLELGPYELALNLQGTLKGLALCFAVAERTLSFYKRTPRQALLSLLGRDTPLTRGPATQLYAEALAPLGITAPGRTKVSLSPAAHAEAEALLAGVPSPRVALGPGARWATKRWPPEHFAALADTLAAQGCSVVLVGGPPDAEALEAFRRAVRHPPAADLSGLSLEALTAGLARVQLLVSGDTGPAHLATAVGTPALVLFGPTSSVRWGPPPPGRALSLGLPCSPCSNYGTEACPLGHHRCLRELGVERVAAEVQARLARPSV